MSEKKFTRRKLLKSAALASAGGLVVGGLSGCSRSDAPTPGKDSSEATLAKEEIKVVGIFPLSGFIAADGEEMRNGLVMAIDEINEMGGLLGRKLKYIEIDDVNSQTDEISTAFERAVGVEKPDVIFSGYHLASGPEFDIVANAGILYYNVNTQKAWTDLYQSDPNKYWSIFQCDPNDEWYGGGFALWLQELVDTGKFKPKVGKKVGILAGDDPYDSFIAQNFEEKIKELSWNVTMKESFTVGNVADWGPLLSKVRDNPPSVLFTTTYNPADNAAMAKQWSANPLPSLVYQQYGPSVPEYMDLAGNAANGIIWATVLGLLPDAIGNDFRKSYNDKFGKQPGWANAGGVYDSLWVWAKAVALAGDHKDYKKIAAITEKSIHRGVTGGISFVNHAGQAYPAQTNDPSLGQSHIIVQIQNGEHKVISPHPYNNGDFQLPPWFQKI